MSFLPIQACCLEGKTLPGTPVGQWQPPDKSHSIGRYHAKSKDGRVVDEKAAVILFYDLFGLGIVRSHSLCVRPGALTHPSLIRRSWQMLSRRDSRSMFSSSTTYVSPKSVSSLWMHADLRILQLIPLRRSGSMMSWRVNRTRTRISAGSKQSRIYCISSTRLRHISQVSGPVN